MFANGLVYGQWRPKIHEPFLFNRKISKKNRTYRFSPNLAINYTPCCGKCFPHAIIFPVIYFRYSSDFQSADLSSALILRVRFSAVTFWSALQFRVRFFLSVFSCQRRYLEFDFRSSDFLLALIIRG